MANNSMQKSIQLLFFFLLISSMLGAKTIYVSLKGNDKHKGTKEKPLATFAKAQQMAIMYSATSPVEVIFDNGIYYLANTIVFNSNVHTTAYPITFKAANEAKVVISGGSLLKLKWKAYKDGIFVAKVKGSPDIDQLYINEKRQRMARFPNAIEGRNVYDTWELSHNAKADPTNDPTDLKRIASWKNPQGAYMHAMHNYLWGDMHWLVKGKNADGTLDMEGGWQNNRPSKMHVCYRMVENVFEELDADNEWFYDKAEGLLYYKPDAKTDITTAKVEIVRLKTLIEFNGTKLKPIRNIHLDGFVFRHAARTFMENKEPLLRSDWTVYRGGAIMYNGAEDCNISNCEFDHVGGNTIFVNNYNRRIGITACYIHGSGASGVVFVGDPAMVRSPIFRYGKQNYETMDRTPGALGDNYPEDCWVENCLITLTGRDEKQTAPVHISMSHKIRISDCSIYDVPRAGININEGTFGGHIIENCDIFNTVLETGDHGSFNSWGRDRYWTPDIKETSMQVAKDTLMPFWDMFNPIIIRNNRWRCDHGWDVDLDDGSTNYEIYNNLLLSGGLKLREGYRRIVTNNIMINNGLHPHVWYTNSGDVFKHNIVFKAHQPAIMNAAIPVDGQWGKEVDYNFYVTSKSNMHKFAKNNCDLNSINGDPLFVDAKNGDFSVVPTSAALKIGFKNFPMNNFGVKKPSLKAIAKTAPIPTVNVAVKPETLVVAHKTYSWMSVELKEPSGDEMSAFGVAFDAGGVMLTMVSEQSVAAQMGFRTGDLIQAINGVKIKTINDLSRFIDANANAKKHEIVLIRNQANFSLIVNRELPKVLK